MSHESRETPVPRIERVSAVRDLLPALMRGAVAAMCEKRMSGDFSSLRKLYGIGVLESFYRSLYDIHTSDAAALSKAFRTHSKMLGKGIRARPVDEITKKAAEVLGAIDADMLEILKLFPGYTVGDSYLNIGSSIPKTDTWHVDGLKGEDLEGWIRIIRTYDGEHTYFTLDPQGGDGDNVTTLSGPGVSAHFARPTRAWHKAPPGDPSARVVVVMWLRPLTRP